MLSGAEGQKGGFWVHTREHCTRRTKETVWQGLQREAQRPLSFLRTDHFRETGQALTLRGIQHRIPKPWTSAPSLTSQR